MIDKDPAFTPLLWMFGIVTVSCLTIILMSDDHHIKVITLFSWIFYALLLMATAIIRIFKKIK